MRKLYYILFSVLIAHSALAVEFPAKWRACKKNSDCAEVSSTCGESKAVHQGYKKKALKKICMAEDCNAMGCDKSGRHAWEVKCVEGKCAPDFDANMPEQNIRLELKDIHMECPKENPNCGLVKRP